LIAVVAEPVYSRLKGKRRSGMAKLQHLEGLRGSAAFVVVMHHFACAFLPAAIFGGAVAANMAAAKTLYQTPLGIFVAGNLAVCIFFVLSGFVLSHKFFQTKDHEVVRSSAVRRYFRLMPPIMGSILIAYVLMHLALFYNHPAARISGSSMWLGVYWSTLPGFREALYEGFYGIITGNSNPGIFNNVLWTMSLEFFGSFLVFGFLALFGRMHHRWLAYILAAFVTFNSYYLAFVIGIALSDFVTTKWSPQSLPWRVTVPLGLLGIFLGAAPLPSTTATMYSAFYFLGGANNATLLIHTLAAGFIMVALLYSPLLKRVLSTAPFRYLGRVSFSLYLLHVLVIGTVSSYVFVQLSGLHHYSLTIALTFIATLAVAFGAAEIFTRYVDQSAIKMSGVFYRKLFNVGAPEKTPVRPALKPAARTGMAEIR
jgi:peptidoglycan/LPS O-acetylase OafA/YrhL